MLPNVPLGFRDVAIDSVISLPGEVPPVGDSLPSSKLRERPQRSLGETGDPGLLVEAGPPKRNMWTVSVVEDTHNNVELRLNDMLYIVDGYVPLRNWYNLSPRGTEKTRIIVPVSEAVASSVPSLFSAMHERGARCAPTTFMALSDNVSKMRTSPDVGAT